MDRDLPYWDMWRVGVIDPNDVTYRFNGEDAMLVAAYGCYQSSRRETVNRFSAELVLILAGLMWAVLGCTGGGSPEAFYERYRSLNDSTGEELIQINDEFETPRRSAFNSQAEWHAAFQKHFEENPASARKEAIEAVQAHHENELTKLCWDTRQWVAGSPQKGVELERFASELEGEWDTGFRALVSLATKRGCEFE